VRAGAFVLQFKTGSDFDTGNVEGRLEHIASGITASFSSADQLLSALARLRKENGPEPRDHD